MQTKQNIWTTKPQSNSTHIVDDGGMVYWIAAPGKTASEVAKAFAYGYDGRLGRYEVTTIATEEAEYFEA